VDVAVIKGGDAILRLSIAVESQPATEPFVKSLV
jgi:hypothetical protein